MKAKTLDKIFDSDKEVLQFFDTANAGRPNLEQKRVNLDLPIWMINSLDKEARRLGVTRQSIMKIWMSEKISDAQKTNH